MGANAIGQDQITFGVSEDMGGGMTAFANIRLAPDISAGTIAGDASVVGIKGAFGSLQLGSDYGTTWYTANMSDATGWGVGAGNVHGIATGGVTTDVVIYTLPTMVEGLGVTVATRPGGAADKSGNATAYMLSYGVGGFKAQYAGASLKNADAQTWSSSSIGGSAALDADAVDNGTTSSADALALTYDFGMAKVYVGTTSAKTGGDADQKGSSSIYGVSIPFGAASIAISSSEASYKSAAGATTKETGMRIMAKYALSKRTTAYLQNGTSKVTGTTRANTQTGLGLTHNF